MGRYFSPILFLAAGIYVFWYNGTDGTSILTLPFIDRVYPAAKGNLILQGRITATLFTAIGALTLIRAIHRSVSEPSDPRLG